MYRGTQMRWKSKPTLGRIDIMMSLRNLCQCMSSRQRAADASAETVRKGLEGYLEALELHITYKGTRGV